MDSPFVRTDAVQAAIRQVDALADAHAGVAKQQEDISAQVVASDQLLLEELILVCGERSGQTLGCARDIFTAQQMSEFNNPVGPRQFAEDGAQSDEAADAGRGGQRRSPHTQARHPSEDVRIAA
jgi:hypothetical protein